MEDADPRVTLAVAVPSRVAESPMWHPREQALYWCDIAGHRLHRWRPAGGDLSHWDFDCDLASCAPMQDGGLLLAMRDGLWRFDTGLGRRKRMVAPPYDVSRERFNDGKCDPQGRFWVGTIYEPRDTACAALYCFTYGEIRRMAGGITVSNGLAWSIDGRTLYWADTQAHSVYAFDFEGASGDLARRRVFARFPDRSETPVGGVYGGRPDGAAVDAEDCYWVAMYEGGRLLRIDPQGRLVDEVRLPVCCPTMPCFGGADLKTLYITTAREKRPPAELAAQPWAGCILSLRLDVPGLPVHVYE